MNQAAPLEETNEHIFIDCECSAIADLRRRLRSTLQSYGLPLSLPVLGGQLNIYKLPLKATEIVLKETGEFIDAVISHFKLPLLKRWKSMFSVPGQYHFDALPP
jgi:hypothetical protein